MDRPAHRLAALVPALPVAVALLVRGLAWVEWSRWPGSRVAILDPAWHLARAAGILGGDLANGATTWAAAPGPAYLFALAGVIAGGVSPAVGVGVSILLDLGLVEVTRRLGERLGGRAVGLVAGLAAALSGPLVFHDLTLLCVSPAALGLGLALLGALGESLGGALGSGIALGVAALFRPNLLLLAPLPAVLAGKRRGFAFLLGLALALAPGLIRNGRVGGDWVPISANSGANLWMAQQDGLHANFPPPIPGPNNLGAMTAWFQGEAERRAGRTLSPGAADAVWRAEAWKAIALDPRSVVDRTARRFLLALTSIDVQDHYAWRPHQRDQRVLGLLPDLGWLAPGLTAVGAWLAWRRGQRRVLAALVGTVVGVALSLAPFVVVERYRLPGVVAALPLMAAAVVWIVRERRWGAALAVLAVCGLASVDPFKGRVVLPDALALPGTTSWSAESGPGREADEASNVASAFLAAGDTAQAEAFFRRAVTVQPGRTTDIVNLAALVNGAGRREEALALLREQTDAHATDVEATLALCGLLLQRPEDAREALSTCVRAGTLAPARWDTLFQAAMAQWQVGDLDGARKTLALAARASPGNARIAAALKAMAKE